MITEIRRFSLPRGDAIELQRKAPLCSLGRQHLSGVVAEMGSTTVVMYAQMFDVRGDDHKEIVAVLDPGGTETEQELSLRGESGHRELAIWKLTNRTWSLVDKKDLSGNQDLDPMIAFPELSSVTPKSE